MRLPKRNIITNKKNINKLIKYKQYNNRFKPNGLWYSCYNEWYKYIAYEDMKNKQNKYIHRIDIFRNKLTNLNNPDPNKILVINSEIDIKKFTNKYKLKNGKQTIKKKPHMPKLIMDSTSINWIKVAKDFGGIEFCPYINPFNNINFNSNKNIFIYNWYKSIDIASGCIWNLQNILNKTQIIYVKNKTSYIKYP